MLVSLQIEVEVMTLEVFEPTGQLVTSGGHEVMVYSVVCSMQSVSRSDVDNLIKYIPRR